MFASLPQVAPGTAKSFEHLDSKFQFRVVGDGRVEPAIADSFASANFIESLDDRRLRKFAAERQRLSEEGTSKNIPTETLQARLQESAKELLGSGWAIDELRSNSGFIQRVQLQFNEPGAGSQSLNFQNLGESTLSLTTEAMLNGWSVSHSINCDQAQGSWTESAQLQR